MGEYIRKIHMAFNSALFLDPLNAAKVELLCSALIGSAQQVKSVFYFKNILRLNSTFQFLGSEYVILSPFINPSVYPWGNLSILRR